MFGMSPILSSGKLLLDREDEEEVLLQELGILISIIIVHGYCTVIMLLLYSYVTIILIMLPLS